MEKFLEGFNRPLEVYIARALFVLLLLAGLWGSFYTVGNSEEATVLRFGKFIGITGPGLHPKIPFIDTVAATEVTTVHRIEVGFNTDASTGGASTYTAVPADAEMLTGDDNIVNLDFVVQYRRVDAMKWQFKVANPEEALRLMAESAMRLVVGQSPFDKVTTVGKAQVQAESAKVLQSYVNELDLGVQIVSIQLQDVLPPDEVAPAFKDVATAREDASTAVEEANKHAQKVVPEARGQASQIINDALGYAATRVQGAEGDVERFNLVLAKYLAAPEVTKDRLILETQEQVLRGQTVIVDQSDGSMLKFFDVNHPNTEGETK